MNKSCILVMVVAAVERFVFKGLVSNLVMYLTEVLDMTNSSAAKIVNSFVGFSFLLPLLGAILADKYFNRYSCILASSVVYVAGIYRIQEPLCIEDPDQSISIDNKTEVADPIKEKKSVLRLMPIWASLLSFAIVFQQTATFFTKQGMAMNRSIGNNITIPPATLQCAINVSILLLTPFYDQIAVPIFRVITRSQKGMFLSIISMTVAAVVERKRLQIGRRMTLEPPLSILWLLPQYILLSLSDVFTVVGMQDFFYSEMSNKRKTVGMAINSSVFGVGCFLSALLILLMEILTSNREGNDSWFADDMRKAHVDKFYWLLASLSAFSLVMFGWSCKYYNKRK